MDEQTARQEAIAFSTSPGDAMTYQVWKLQILKFLASACMQQGDKFKHRVFSIPALPENKAPLHRPATREIFGKSSYHFINSRSLFVVETALKKIPDAV